MPRYHFHVHDGVSLPDVEGQELADLDSARAMAVCHAGECLRDYASDFWDSGEWRMEVTDDAGRTLFTLSFAASNGADAATPPR